VAIVPGTPGVGAIEPAPPPPTPAVPAEDGDGYEPPPPPPANHWYCPGPGFNAPTPVCVGGPAITTWTPAPPFPGLLLPAPPAPPPPPPTYGLLLYPSPPSVPCAGDVGVGEFPDPPPCEVTPPPPPPDPPARNAAPGRSGESTLPPPAPPPLDVMEPKTEGVPVTPRVRGVLAGFPPWPPPPTVTVYGAIDTGNAEPANGWPAKLVLRPPAPAPPPAFPPPAVPPPPPPATTRYSTVLP